LSWNASSLAALNSSTKIHVFWTSWYVLLDSKLLQIFRNRSELFGPSFQIRRNACGDNYRRLKIRTD